MARALIRPDTLYAWKGPSLLVVNTRGECGLGRRDGPSKRTVQPALFGRVAERPDLGEGGPDPSAALGAGQGLSGYYFREARFLSTCRLEINGHPPWLSEVAAVEPDLLEFSYTFPEVTNYGGGGSGQSGDDEPRDERGLPQRGLNIQLT